MKYFRETDGGSVKKKCFREKDDYRKFASSGLSMIAS